MIFVFFLLDFVNTKKGIGLKLRVVLLSGKKGFFFFITKERDECKLVVYRFTQNSFGAF